MADLTRDAPLRFWNDKLVFSEHWYVDSTAARTIYKGQPMIMDLDVDTVYPVQYVDAVEVAATDIFIGIAAHGHTTAIASTEAVESNSLEIYVYPTIIGFKSTVYTDADVGDTVYMRIDAYPRLSESMRHDEIRRLSADTGKRKEPVDRVGDAAAEIVHDHSGKRTDRPCLGPIESGREYQFRDGSLRERRHTRRRGCTCEEPLARRRRHFILCSRADHGRYEYTEW